MFSRFETNSVSESSGLLLEANRIRSPTFSVLSPARHALSNSEPIRVDPHAAVVASKDVVVVIKAHALSVSALSVSDASSPARRGSTAPGSDNTRDC